MSKYGIGGKLDTNARKVIYGRQRKGALTAKQSRRIHHKQRAFFGKRNR